ncbi:uncharacterized protein MELLADRAFT_100969 [Melampsora larici-populina 98AG31]|uniref:t-SNARE coiled-coil homology domain-containing protein n=1 Tax=Melampsora larici-populina (strain 98AG31 / pathotype 3-4-7) TaxID=747676 RepID=F4R359_MELLP|nr:uncharacterized protein MELLADRAFT_100969 [Melampsora larici-populina 98AG31]EGG12572.1 hypothetical protein MELLADRAFT_100969 [Melampsora larici-populina 98AG31]
MLIIVFGIHRIDYSDEVEELIEQIKTNLNQLEKLTSKQLLPSFTDRSNEEKEIDQLTHQITRQFRTSQVLIGKIGENQDDSNSKPKAKAKTKENQKVIQNVQVGLMSKIQELSQTFQKRQRVYLQHLKSTETSNPNHALINITDDQPSPRSHSSFSQQQQQQQQTRSFKSNQVDLQQRDREIEGISQSILELSEMFKDLSVLVIDQGTMLDRIDYHVEEMSRNLKGAVNELQIANKHSNRSGKCKLIFLLIILIFAAILLLVFKPRHSPTTTPSTPPSTSTTSTSQSNNPNTIASNPQLTPSISNPNKFIKLRSKLKQRWKDD